MGTHTAALCFALSDSGLTDEEESSPSLSPVSSRLSLPTEVLAHLFPHLLTLARLPKHMWRQAATHTSANVKEEFF